MENDLIKKLYSEVAFEELSTEVVKELANHISNTTNGKNEKTIRWNTPEKELKFWLDFLENGRNDEFISEILKRTTHTHHPKYVGHQVAAPSPITALTSMVSSILNNGMAVYEMGMSPSAIERIVTDKVCAKIGYGSNSGGFLTSGGTLANLTALLSARKAIVKHDVWNEGHKGQLGIMVCEEAHYCVDRAARIMGLGEQGIIKVPAGEDYSLNTDLLNTCFQQAKAKGIEIFAIIGSAPSTATGAYDNLHAIAQFAESKQIWFHVDGAHGGAAIYSKKYKHLVTGIDKADSVVIDGHKMMLMPTITTALLFKDKRHAQHTFSQKADYLLNDTAEDQWYQSGKKTFECTKTMMSLHWYVLLKFYGEAIFDEFVTRQYDLAQEFAEMVQEHPSFELATWPQSNILCFRVIEDSKSNEELNDLNARIRQLLLEDGEFYLVQTKLRGVLYLRTTLMNAFTTKSHLSDLLEKIVAVKTTV
ncbi:pyridoxal phosphate-dependent decarboxylase family protein [Croceivirga thetidis]|uniref:Pyridoxal-dependent decarboxylase n=1 Tax=Croceivirga thetidis TaxID=2721623 RepID=A0ABX1GRX5_9FLAO|nr:pyridoxal-dependent decarboxylase [Croceivirga thetidis]NKI32690.1 pyridoxal-dependent decarboxylase [Croceivirga thetidis]